LILLRCEHTNHSSPIKDLGDSPSQNKLLEAPRLAGGIMNTLIMVGLFVGLAFILAAGLFSVANDLRLRIEYPPLAHPDGDDEAETELANDASPLSQSSLRS
jgi:hypothetical protein